MTGLFFLKSLYSFPIFQNCATFNAGHLVPGHLACAGEEHHRGGPHQPQAQHGLHRGQYIRSQKLYDVNEYFTGLHQLAVPNLSLSNSNHYPNHFQYSYL